MGEQAEAAGFSSIRKIPMCTRGPLSGGGFTHIDFEPPDPRGERSEIEVEPYKKANNKYFWFALYTVPDDLPRIYKNSLGGHQRAFTGSFTAVDDENRPIRELLDVVREGRVFSFFRPPVILVHGLDDNGGSWDLERNRILYGAGFDVRAIDYRASNGASFEENKLRIFESPGKRRYCKNGSGGGGSGCTINEVIGEYRGRGIAISKLDVVAHSMGGILARVFHDQPEYRVPENFNQGYIRRLITIATPHLGANAANIIVEDLVRHKASGCGMFLLLAGAVMNDVNNPFFDPRLRLRFTSLDATRDLAIGSDAMNRIGRTRVLAHAITSAAKLPLRGLYWWRFQIARGCINWERRSREYNVLGVEWLGKGYDNTQAAFVRSICGGKGTETECDWTMNAESARGGLKEPHVTSFSLEDISHGEQIGSSIIHERIKLLLEAPNAAFDPDGFPPVACLPQPPNSLGFVLPRGTCPEVN
ncbi:MAG: hypothetical protein IPM25_01235 [Chloracidobacterium sp.]|nr:hypothetical protein [Chloracidobacterium sp.]